MTARFSRREMLAAFLGLPAALAGCSAHDQAPDFAGEIVGASHQVGHRLRSGERPARPERWQRAPVLIVGAGIAGLAAGWRLRQAGLRDFILLELETAPGGNARSGHSPLVSYPWGAHYIPAPLKDNRLLVSLFEEMGLIEGFDREGEPVVGEQFLCRDPQERIFYRGRWYEGLYLHAGASPEDQAQLKAFNQHVGSWIAWRDGRGRRAFAIPIASGSDDAELTALDKLSMAEWLEKHNFTSARLRWLVDYACRDDYGTRPEETSAWAGLFYFASRVRRPGAEPQPLVTWPEGNGRLVQHLYAQVEKQARLGLAVLEIAPAPAGGVEAVAFDCRTQSLLGFRADQLIFAAPQFLTRHVLHTYRDETLRHVAEFEYGAWMVANLFLRDRPREGDFPLAWDNVLYDSPSLGYVVATHQRGLDRGPTVLTYYYPLCDASPREARARLLGMDWRDCADLALTDLARAHSDLRSLVERLDVMRWGHAMIRPRPGFLWGRARRAAARPHGNVYFAHSDLSGVSLFEEAFYHGVRAAEEVLAARGLQLRSLVA
jgi:Flavin containing amine oxidoreductase